MLTITAYDEEEDEEEDELTPPGIVRFVPEDTSTCKAISYCIAVLALPYVVETMFSALSQCQLLHPDPEEESEEEEEERGQIIELVSYVSIKKQ